MILLAAALAVSAPSFDCAKATTEVEKMICGTERLARSDQAVAMAYRAASKGRQAAKIIREQRKWLTDRDKCDDVDCLVDSYEWRLFELLAISGLGREYAVGDGYLRVVTLDDDWYAFSVFGLYLRPPNVANDAEASGVFKLVNGKGERLPLESFDKGWRLTKLKRGWRVECLPDITSCGGLNATIDGDYR